METNTSTEPVIKELVVGAFQVNCYLCVCPVTREAVLIDPGDEADRIQEWVEGNNVKLLYIINTHGHIDHIMAIDPIKSAFNTSLAIHELDSHMYLNQPEAAYFGLPTSPVKSSPTFLLKEDSIITFGSLQLKVIHTPGHTPGSISLLCSSRQKPESPLCVFSGDTLFQHGIGRTDLPGGNTERIYESIRTKLYKLDGSLKVYPGHGPATTVGEEKLNNPFVHL